MWLHRVESIGGALPVVGFLDRFKPVVVVGVRFDEIRLDQTQKRLNGPVWILPVPSFAARSPGNLDP
jgi:hypothetical protein